MNYAWGPFSAGAQDQPRKYARVMAEMMHHNFSAVAWCEEIPKQQWTLAYDDHGRRWGHLTTNLSECINGVLKGVRGLPITALVHHTLSRCVSYWRSRKQKALAMQQAQHRFSDTITSKMADNANKANAHSVVEYNRERGVFQVLTARNRVTGGGGNYCTVNLQERRCSCGKFQHFRFPCSHVMAACASISISPDQFVDRIYLVENLLNTYSFPFFPLGHKDYWPTVDTPLLIPNPALVRPKGRPKSTRIRNEMDWRERNQAARCSLCHATGHNKKTCPNKQIPFVNREEGGPSH